jgi:hypothetical protein
MHPARTLRKSVALEQKSSKTSVEQSFFAGCPSKHQNDIHVCSIEFIHNSSSSAVEAEKLLNGRLVAAILRTNDDKHLFSGPLFICSWNGTRMFHQKSLVGMTK